MRKGTVCGTQVITDSKEFYVYTRRIKTSDNGGQAEISCSHGGGPS